MLSFPISASLMIVTVLKNLGKFKPEERFHRVLVLPAVMLASPLCSPQVWRGRGRCYHLWRRQKLEPIRANFNKGAKPQQAAGTSSPELAKTNFASQPAASPPVPSRPSPPAPPPGVMAFTLSEIMAARRQQSQGQSHGQRGGRTAVEVDEYSTNPTQAFTFYNINQGRFQPPHVHMWVSLEPVGALK